MAINLLKNDGQLEPPPDQINLKTGKSMWIIKDYRIWARTYQEALELLTIIELY